MDSTRQNAYRHLLHVAMVEIRSTLWGCKGVLNAPSHLHQIAKAAALADWLHNMAESASNGFEGFYETWFWRGFDALKKQFPDVKNYRDIFDYKWAEFEALIPLHSMQDADRVMVAIRSLTQLYRSNRSPFLRNVEELKKILLEAYDREIRISPDTSETKEARRRAIIRSFDELIMEVNKRTMTWDPAKQSWISKWDLDQLNS